MKKEEEDFFVGSGGKKKGKGRKTAGDGASSTTKSGKFNLDPGTIKGLSGLGIDPPASQGEVPSVIEKLREKLDFFKKDQDRKTKEVRPLSEDTLARKVLTRLSEHCGRPERSRASREGSIGILVSNPEKRSSAP
jgi:hypothetical protein